MSTPAAFQAAWVSPEQSYERGPVAPQTYGLPIWARAKARTLSALVVALLSEPVRRCRPRVAAGSGLLRGLLGLARPPRPWRPPADGPAPRPCAWPPPPSSAPAPRAAPSPRPSASTAVARASPSFFWTFSLLVRSVACDSVSVSRLFAASARFFVAAACCVRKSVDRLLLAARHPVHQLVLVEVRLRVVGQEEGGASGRWSRCGTAPRRSCRASCAPRSACRRAWRRRRAARRPCSRCAAVASFAWLYCWVAVPACR